MLVLQYCSLQNFKELIFGDSKVILTFCFRDSAFIYQNSIHPYRMEVLLIWLAEITDVGAFRPTYICLHLS
jgi:hypothetical protein